MGRHANPLSAFGAKDVEGARRLQEDLRRGVRIRPIRKTPRYIAACDASYACGRAVGAVCLYSYPGIEPVEQAVASVRCRFPYVPGYLSFREGPAIIKAIGKLKRRPGLLMLDGQGIAHPRGMGIAAHLGVVLGLPSIGCAKSRLTGAHEEPGRERGSRAILTDRPRESGGPIRPIGAVLRTRTAVRPVFVSPGHMIDIDGAVEVVLAASGRYRLPEPLRCAHSAANRAAKMLKCIHG